MLIADKHQTSREQGLELAFAQKTDFFSSSELKMEEKTAQLNTRAFGTSMFRENIKPKTTKKSWFAKYDEQKSKGFLETASAVYLNEFRHAFQR